MEHVTVPRIETERLQLRGHRLDDYPACTAMWADPAVTRFIGGTPSSPQQTWARMLAYVGHWSMRRFGYWALEEKDSGTFVGELGFADFKRDIAPSMSGVPELGWALVSSAHGRGFATEAVRAAVAWGDAAFGSARTVCLIHPDNVASIRVAQKNDYRVFASTTLNGRATLFLERSTVETTS